MIAWACEIPAASALDRSLIAAAHFRDSYCAPLANPNASVIEIFVAVFGRLPASMKRLSIVRNRMASLCGLEAPTTSEVVNIENKDRNRVGDKIGPWPIFMLRKSELIAGRNNKHLDFRVSALKQTGDGGSCVVISTVCAVHNTFGKVYLFFIVPFHKWGVQRLMANAVRASRL